MQVSTNSFFRNNVENLQDLKSQTINLQEQISTGKKVNVASDDPVAFSSLALLKARDSRLTQYGSNINVAHQRLTLEETTLTQVTNVLTRLHELSIQGANDTLSATDRQLMSTEVKGLSDTLYGLANTQDANGQPIFSGFQTSQPFVKDANGAVNYTGDSYEVAQSVGDNQQVSVGFSGFDVFSRVPVAGGPSKSVFQIVKQIGDSLAAGRSPATPGDDISSALNHITAQLAEVGARTSTLDAAQTQLDSLKTANTNQMSSLQDTDMEKAISDLTQKMTTMDAAQSSFVKIAQISLFNYLK